jgi:hypothetical protein
MTSVAARPRHVAHVALIALAAVVILLLTPTVALADPAGPTNWESVITSIEPDAGKFEVRSLGGDAFLQLVAAPGTEIVVPGYDGEELYLRYDADGTVHLNQRTRTHYQNEDRYGADPNEVPANIGKDAPPDWTVVATGGSYAWHDHRIHWMSPKSLPPAIDPAGGPQSMEWSEPIVLLVDGEEVLIHGELRWYPDTSPAPAGGAALIAFVGVLALGWRKPALGIVGGVGAAALIALATALPANVGLPTGVQGQPLQLILPAVGLLALVAGHLTRNRSPFALAIAGAGGLTLVAWGLTQSQAITAPILPSGPASLVRVAVGLAVGAGLAAAVLGVRTVLTPQEISATVPD